MPLVILLALLCGIVSVPSLKRVLEGKQASAKLVMRFVSGLIMLVLGISLFLVWLCDPGKVRFWFPWLGLNWKEIEPNVSPRTRKKREGCLVKVDFPSSMLSLVWTVVRKQLWKLALQLLPNLLSLPICQTSLFFTWNINVPQWLKGLMKTSDTSGFDWITSSIPFSSGLWAEDTVSWKKVS